MIGAVGRRVRRGSSGADGARRLLAEREELRLVAAGRRRLVQAAAARAAFRGEFEDQEGGQGSAALGLGLGLTPPLSYRYVYSQY